MSYEDFIITDYKADAIQATMELWSKWIALEVANNTNFTKASKHDVCCFVVFVCFLTSLQHLVENGYDNDDQDIYSFILEKLGSPDIFHNKGETQLLIFKMDDNLSLEIEIYEKAVIDVKLNEVII